MKQEILDSKPDRSEKSQGETGRQTPAPDPSIFIIGFLALVVLWLPPLPYTLKAADFPQAVFRVLSAVRAVKPAETWPLRWDYLVFPILVFWALRIALRSRISIREAGLGAAHLGEAVRILWKPTLIGALLLLATGGFCHSIDITPRFWSRLNPLSGLFQQMAIQLFFHRQWMAWFGPGRKTAWILALFFSALHAPNPGLMLGTLYGMYIWARCYQRAPNLYALAVSHSFLSALLMHTMPKWLLPSVSVGNRFMEKGMAHGWWGWF